MTKILFMFFFLYSIYFFRKRVTAKMLMMMMMIVVFVVKEAEVYNKAQSSKGAWLWFRWAGIRRIRKKSKKEVMCRWNAWERAGGHLDLSSIASRGAFLAFFISKSGEESNWRQRRTASLDRVKMKSNEDPKWGPKRQTRRRSHAS